MNAEAKKLSQFYTNADLSQLMAEKISDYKTLKVFDLGAGKGALLKPFFKRNKEGLKYILAVDIDNHNCEYLNTKKIKVENVDSSKKKNINNLILKHGLFDACVINPPFRFVAVEKNEIEVLNDFGLEKYSSHKKIPSEIIFLINAMSLLRVGGVCAAILPDRIVTSSKWKFFRETLINNFYLKEVVSIPEKSFAKTEAIAHVLVLVKKLSHQKIMLSHVNNLRTISVAREEFVNRGDFGFYFNKQKINEVLNGDYYIYRGRLSFKEIKALKCKYVHTNNICSLNNFFDERVESLDLLAEKIVRRGDVVVARVGTRVIGKVNMVRSSGFLPSDCIIVIRSKNWLSMIKIFRLLKSGKLSKMIVSNAKGVAAKYITLNDFKDMGIGL